jgi:hypothetical protein
MGELGMVVLVCNTSPQETEEAGLQVQGKPGPYLFMSVDR